MFSAIAMADWTQFRGTDGSGVAKDTGLPLKWDATTGIAWKTDLPGPGSSSPVVLGDKVFLTCYSGYGLDQRNPGNQENLTFHVLCLNRKDGSIVWDKTVKAKTPEPKYGGFMRFHGYASSTPAVEKDAVYTFFGRTGVLAWSHDGKQLWRSDVGSRTHGWGTGTSPILYNDLVIVNACVESSSLVALNKKTGEQAWSQRGLNLSWNTPLLVDVNNGQELVVSIRSALKAFDPAKGTPLWNCTGIHDYVCPSVVAHDGVVFAIGGRKNTALAVRAGGKGNVSQSHTLWRINKGSNVTSPVYHAGHIYWAHESRGSVYCVNGATGDVVYEARLQPPPRLIYASPVVADGRLYYVSREKGTYVLAAKPEFELLAHNVISTDKSVFNGSPAVSNGQLLIRSDRALYCIGKK